MPIRAIREFLKLEAAGGILLFIAAVLALIIDNTPWHIYYERFFDAPLGFQIAQWTLSKPLILWINDGFMAIFFFLVGLEIKRELIEGDLNSLAKVALPGIAAIGGMLVPAIIYIAFAGGDKTIIQGWAIPTATDIAFALGILSLLGSRVHPSLKIFLTALAIFDDIGAIAIIAVFYTKDIAQVYLLEALLCILVLVLFNRFNVKKIAPYILVGIIMWFCVLKSGVHATLAGVVLAFTIPLKDKSNPDNSPLKRLEHHLHPWVAFAILPIFSFANAGVSFAGMHVDQLVNPVTLGIALGLFVGKQIGVFLSSWLAIKFGWAQMPTGANWRGIYGMSLICGVGFTMSLFIGTLAFKEVGTEYATLVRTGVIAGSLLSGLCGYLLLRCCLPKRKHEIIVYDNSKEPTS